MKENVKVDGEINAGWTSYFGDGETIRGTTEDDLGDEETDWYPNHVNPDELTKSQRAVIRQLYTNPRASQGAVADKAGVSKATVRNTIQKYNLDVDWAARAEARGEPGQAEHIRAASDDSSQNQENAGKLDVDEVRRRLLDGATTKELADEYGVNSSTISQTATGKRRTETDSEIGPIEYDFSEGRYVRKSDSDDEDDSSDIDPEDSVEEDDTHVYVVVKKTGSHVSQLVGAYEAASDADIAVGAVENAACQQTDECVEVEELEVVSHAE